MANEAFKLNYSIKFQLEKRKQDGILITSNLPIQMVITFNGQRLKLYAGYRIDSAKWDNENERVKKGSNNSKKETWNEINSQLGKLSTAIVNAFDSFRFKKTIPTLDEIKSAFREAQGKKELTETASFYNTFKLFVAEQSKENTWSDSTVKKMNTVYNTLYAYDDKLSLNSLDSNKLQGYIDFLRIDKEYRNSTIAKQLKLVKWFLKWALRKQLTFNTSFLDFKPKLAGVTEFNENIVFLTLEECKYLYSFDAKKDYLNRVKDVFLFCCFTGIRFSDVFKLTKSDVKDGYIAITTQKTTDKLNIQLNQYSLSILAKYSDTPFDDNKALPVISNQKMNKYLKELCKDAGFNESQKMVYFRGNQRIEEVKAKHELIGTHTARRSFISNAITLGIPVEIVIRWTGHKDYKAMSPYLKILESKKIEQMAKFDA
nr:site-specific integrase [Pedobacter kyonggii]